MQYAMGLTVSGSKALPLRAICQGFSPTSGRTLEPLLQTTTVLGVCSRFSHSRFSRYGVAKAGCHG